MAGQTGDSRRATILVNPAARGVHRFHPGDACDLLEAHGLKTSVRVAHEPGDLRRLAAAAARERIDFVFVVAGDGGFREAAGSLAGSESVLAVLPAGTANVWAREIGIPRNFEKAITLHLRGQVRRADVGRANGDPFLLTASIGWDAEVVRHVGGKSKRLLGELAYIAEGVRALPSLRPYELRWSLDGAERVDDVAILVVSNTRLYGGRVKFSPGALVDDGLLDVCALSPERRGDGVKLAARLVSGRLAGHPRVLSLAAREISVHTPDLPFELDGDPVGMSPVTVRVEPGAVRVSLPPGPVPAIFRATAPPAS